MSNDESPPASGSRWEPAEQPPATPAATPAAGSPVAYAPAPPPRNRGRLLLAGGAVGVALVAGAGGFALGHASADEGDGPGGRFGGPGGVLNQFPGGPVPGGPQGGQGTFPGQGQDGLPPGFPGRDDDDQDQHDGQPDDGTTQGSST